MGKSKTILFTETQNQLAQTAKALAHPARIAILQLLSRKQSCFCGDIVEELPLSQSTVSQHLKALKEAGLIKGDIEGPSICYCIDNEVWQELTKQLGLFMQEPSNKNCC
ncbi:MAG: metalloregulator ArsR/SmtB family transcription factor [Balneolales bacterium]|nr:metalloregulator ArsR/SmtB family transcription factor [Balneolales bacterium]